MSYFLLALSLLCCYGISLKTFQADYLSINKTTSIKGIFTLLIFLKHSIGYISPYPANDIGRTILSLLGQMVVVMFFFYSGFGIMKQYELRGKTYLKSFPKNRILKLLVHFDIAVLLYLIVQILLGNKYPLTYYLTCWIGWSSIGNSNWFIFVILILYLISYITLSTIEKKASPKVSALLLLFSLSFLLWLFLRYTHLGETWWYNTIIAFPLGAAYSQMHSKVDAFHEKRPFGFAIITTICALLWIVSRKSIGIDPYGLSTALFCFSTVGVTSFVSIDNSILRWIGKNCFNIYILQRIPMIIISHFGLNHFFYLFIICSLVLTILLVLGFRKLTDMVDNLVI